MTEIQAPPAAAGQGIVGISQGLTIPGPKGSYMAARADVAVYLPCDPTPEGVEAALGSCKAVVEEHLDRMAEEIRQFFAS